MTENERKRLAAYLSEYVAGVAGEWMRIIEIDEDVVAPGSAQTQAHVEWAGDGAFKVGEQRYGEEFGHYRLTVHVEPVDVPPLGPENDLGVYGIDDRAPEMWDPDYPGCAPEECGGSRLDPCGTVMRTQGRRHDGGCANCAPYRAGASADRVDGSDLDTPCVECGAVEDLPTWAVATWSVVLPGDRVRLGAVEATVIRRYAGEWYSMIETKTLDDGRLWDKISPWKHREVKVVLQMDGRPEQSYTMPPNGEVEILCDAARTAVLLVQTELGQGSDWPAEAGEWNRKVMQSEDPVGTYFAHKRAADRIGPRERGSVWTKPEAKG